MNSIVSSTIIMNTGTPQGCVLSPLLYSLFKNDCVSHHSTVPLLKFTDDTTLVGLVSDSDESEYRHEVSSLVSWCDTNNLQLNASKTREMIVDFRKRKNPLAPIIVNGDSIERVDYFKFLGTIISSDLAWENNTDAVVKKAQQRLLPAPNKEVRAEERNSCSVLSFCYREYSYILNMCMVRRHQPAPEGQA